MEYGTIPGVDKPVFRLIVGANQLPTGWDEGAALAQMDEALAAGVNAFDTAHSYDDGGKDRFFGRWMESRGLRERVVVIAKGAHPAEDGGPPRVEPGAIVSDLSESLERMGTGYADLYLLHRDDRAQPVGPIVDALNGLLRDGKCRAFGASNWTVGRLREADEYASATGQTPFAASSVAFSLATWRREPWPGCVSVSGPGGDADRRWYAERPMPLIAWSALASGFWSGRYRPGTIGSLGDGYWERLVSDCYATAENFERLARAERVGAERGLSAAQVALAYVLGAPGLNTFAVVGTGNPEHLAANVAAAGITLTDEERAYLETGEPSGH